MFFLIGPAVPLEISPRISLEIPADFFDIPADILQGSQNPLKEFIRIPCWVALRNLFKLLEIPLATPRKKS